MRNSLNKNTGFWTAERNIEGFGRSSIVVFEERKQILPGDEETLDALITEFVDRIEDELRQIFGFEE